MAKMARYCAATVLGIGAATVLSAVVSLGSGVLDLRAELRPDGNDISRSEYLRKRAAYDEQMERFAAGEIERKPDIASFSSSSDSRHPAAEIEPLSEREKAIVARYALSLGKCPNILRGRGLHVACMQLLEGEAEPVQKVIKGLLNDKANMRALRQTAPATIKERLKQLEQGQDRSNRRPDTVRGKPTSSLNVQE